MAWDQERAGYRAGPEVLLTPTESHNCQRDGRPYLPMFGDAQGEWWLDVSADCRRWGSTLMQESRISPQFENLRYDTSTRAVEILKLRSSGSSERPF